MHYFRLGNADYLIAPDGVLNLGVVRDVELVADFRQFVGLERVPGEAPVRLLDTDVLAKWILRRGTLQGQGGVSIAVEGGPLLPEVGGAEHLGIQADFIFSYRASFGALHLNEQVADSRNQNLELFSDAIFEGPDDWVVRPVTEVFVDRELNATTTYSTLVGAIWSLGEPLALDVGLRAARVDGARAFEARLGFTWVVPVWRPGG